MAYLSFPSPFGIIKKVASWRKRRQKTTNAKMVTTIEIETKPNTISFAPNCRSKIDYKF